MIEIVFFRTSHVLSIDNLVKQPIIYLRIFDNKRKCLIDSGATLSVISENSVPRNCHIEIFQKSVKDLSGKLNILGQISTEIEIGEVKVIERFVVISKQQKNSR